jgi:hypothetical protein
MLLLLVDTCCRYLLWLPVIATCCRYLLWLLVVYTCTPFHTSISFFILHSSFFILHSSFFILHSSFFRATPGHPHISHMIAMSLNDPRVQRMHNVTGLRCTIVLLLGQLAPFIRDTNPAVRRQKMTEDDIGDIGDNR